MLPIVVVFDELTAAEVVNEPLWHTLYLPSDLQYDLTLKQIAGSGRNFDWRVLSP